MNTAAKRGVFACCFVALLILPSLKAQERTVTALELERWMIAVRTLEQEFHGGGNRFADDQELLKFSRTGFKPTRSALIVRQKLNPVALNPYVLLIETSPDGAHYQATIKRRWEPHDGECHMAIIAGDNDVKAPYLANKWGDKCAQD